MNVSCPTKPVEINANVGSVRLILYANIPIEIDALSLRMRVMSALAQSCGNTDFANTDRCGRPQRGGFIWFCSRRSSFYLLKIRSNAVRQEYAEILYLTVACSRPVLVDHLSCIWLSSVPPV